LVQPGFERAGDATLLLGTPNEPLPDPWWKQEAAAARIRPTNPIDALALARLHASATPQPIQRLEALRLADWERQGTAWRVPRSSLAPILRFADVEAYVQESPDGGKDGTLLDGFVQVGVAKEDQPHYLKVIARPGVDSSDLVRYGLGVIAARTHREGGHRHDHGVMAPVRTYEHPVDRALEDHGFSAIATVTLLMKETLVRDLGRPPEARCPEGEVILLEREITEADIAHVVENIGSFGDDNRAGIERTLHRISAIRNRTGKVVGLTCRIGKAVFGTIEIIRDIVESGRSILLLGRPGVGKTTMLREVARVLADDLGKRAVVVDTSNEIAGDGDIPHPGIGDARR